MTFNNNHVLSLLGDKYPGNEILNPNSNVNYDPKQREEAVLKILEEM